MRLLDRYLLRELLIPLGYCLCGFLIFWISFDLLSDLDEFQRRNLLVRDVVEYYLVKMPDLLVVVLPVALLLALLYTLTDQARHNEITAIRSAGVSFWRLSVPYLAIGFLLSLALLGANELWLPDGFERAEAILHRREPAERKASPGKWRQNVSFRNEGANRYWHIQSVNTTTSEMLKPQVEWELEDGSRRHLFAERAIWTNQAWTFFNVQEVWHSSDPGAIPPKSYTDLTLPELRETPEQIKSEIKINSLTARAAAKKAQVSVGDILDYKRLHPRMDAPTRALVETQLYGRLAAPWTCLVVVLIALPFGASVGRRNVFVGVASSIFICFTYFILMRFGLALGTGHKVLPWVAAWFPNLFFSAIGIWLTHRAR